MKLLCLSAGSQAKARHESWKKRQVEIPHDEPPETVLPTKRTRAKKAKGSESEASAG